MKQILLISLFLIGIASHYAGNGVRILSSDENRTLVEFNLEGLRVYDVAEKSFKYVTFSGAMIPTGPETGIPQLPSANVNVGVPSETGLTINVLKAEYDTLHGQIAPIPLRKKDGFSFSSQYIKSENYYSFSPPELVTFGEFGYIRNLPVQSILLHPVQFDPRANVIKVYKKVVFAINFAGSSGRNFAKVDDFLEKSVINFNKAKNWGIEREKINKINNSINLANGVWYKFEAPEEGIYKIDYNTLSSLGIDPATVDPRTIKICNHGGKALDEDINSFAGRPMEEIAIYVEGESDGVFNTNDYILLYGRGVDFFEYSTLQARVARNKNYFSRKNYYFITSGGEDGKRMATRASENFTSPILRTTSTACTFNDSDRINLDKSGRIYVGDEFSSSVKTHTYILPMPGIINGTQVKYRYQIINHSDSQMPIIMEESGSQIANKWLYGPTTAWGTAGKNRSTLYYTWNSQEERSVFKITVNNNDPADKVYLDYIEIEYERTLETDTDELIFFAPDMTGDIRYELSGFKNSAVTVWDITDFSEVKKITGASVSGGEVAFESSEILRASSKYIALCTSKYKSVENIEQVENSQIASFSEGAEYVIITHKNFSDQAERLKKYRAGESDYPISSAIFYIDEIYNQFSSGTVDPTAIRNFLRFAYQNWQTAPFYVLFFGDGTYDYLDVEGKDNNFIPTYQTVESFNEVSSYPTDDYYARISGNDNKLDLAHGRIMVNSPEEAEVTIDKIIEYESESDKSLWRNTITLVADDGKKTDGDDGSTHTTQSETLAIEYIPKYFDLHKIYLAAYPTVNTGLGRRKPDVNKAIVDAVNNGTLLLNFIGHGNPDTWTHEYVYERTITVPQFTNSQYFFLTAATCDFGRYDDPVSKSGTEEMLLLPDAGMIGGFSATRSVFSAPNAALNNEFYEQLLSTRDSDDERLPVGHACLLAKYLFSTGYSENTEKFHIFCDPYLRLNEPDRSVRIDSVNGCDLSTHIQINALGEVEIKGSVLKSQSDEVDSNFNGEGILSVYDSERSFVLKEFNDEPEMLVQGGVIFRGRISIYQGEFSARFTTPKDISYEDKPGKIIAYVYDSSEDGIGFSRNIVIGGTDTTTVDDGEGPMVEIFYDDLNFNNSYLVNPDFTLLISLEDETGLNTTGTGVGHKLEGILNDDEENAIDFATHFIGDLDAGGKSGVVQYKMSNMEQGDYSLKVKAWDIFNNPTVEESFFTVVRDGSLVLQDVVNYPNPFSSTTHFTFQHNLTSPVNVKIRIYTIAGRLIQELEENYISEKFVRIFWDGRDKDADILASGTYIYKLNVETIDGSFRETYLGKLAIIH